MLPSSFTYKLDPTYHQAISNVVANIQFAKNFDARSDLFGVFSGKYMIPKELWNKYFALTVQVPTQEDRERIKSKILLSVYQLYYKVPIDTFAHFGPIRVPKRKLLKWRSAVISAFDIGTGVSPNAASLIKDLSFPSEHLERKWRQYEKSSSSMPPIKVVKMYQKMKALYSKIEMVEENEEEWIKALIEVGDDEFVEHNIEHRLGSNLTNKKLWILYLQYLKDRQEKGIIRLLHTYSKYCRFFVEDKEMKEEYRQAAERYGRPIVVPWTNAFYFEAFSDSALTNYFFPTSDNSSIDDDDEEEENHRLTVHFNPSNLIKQQNFSFKSPFIHYIIQNANARVLQNLFKSCKWFFIKNPIPICYSLVTKQRPMGKPEINFYQQSVEVVKYSLAKTGLENIYLSTALQIITPRDRMLLSDFIPKMFRCDAKYISITNQDLTFDELFFLLGHGNVIDLYLSEVGIIDDKGKTVPVEDVVKLCPRAQFINIGGVADTPNTAKILSEMEFENKIESFNLKIDNLEPHAFAEFLKKNMAPKSKIFIHYKFNNNAEIISNFRQIVGDAINSHWNANEKPTFKTI